MCPSSASDTQFQRVCMSGADETTSCDYWDGWGMQVISHVRYQPMTIIYCIFIGVCMCVLGFFLFVFLGGGWGGGFFLKNPVVLTSDSQAREGIT